MRVRLAAAWLAMGALGAARSASAHGGYDAGGRVGSLVSVSGELEASHLLPNEGWPGERVVLFAGEQVPAQHGELAGHGHRVDVGAAHDTHDLLARQLIAELHRGHERRRAGALG